MPWVLSSTAMCRMSLQQVPFSSPILSPVPAALTGTAASCCHPGATLPSPCGTGGAVLRQCPLPMRPPSRAMSRSPLLAGSKHPQHSPGHQTGVWELCWEAWQCLNCQGFGWVWQPGKHQGGGVQLGSEKHTQGGPTAFSSFLRKRHARRRRCWR